MSGESLGRSCRRAAGAEQAGDRDCVRALCAGSSLRYQWFAKTLTSASFSSLPSSPLLLPSPLLLFLRVILSILWFKPLLGAAVLHSQLLVKHLPWLSHNASCPDESLHFHPPGPLPVCPIMAERDDITNRKHRSHPEHLPSTRP